MIWLIVYLIAMLVALVLTCLVMSINKKPNPTKEVTK
jgi:hypothetical protein